MHDFSLLVTLYCMSKIIVVAHLIAPRLVTGRTDLQPGKHMGFSGRMIMTERAWTLVMSERKIDGKGDYALDNYSLTRVFNGCLARSLDVLYRTGYACCFFYYPVRNAELLCSNTLAKSVCLSIYDENLRTITSASCEQIMENFLASF